MKKIVVLLFGILYMVSCKSQQTKSTSNTSSTGPQDTKESTVYKGVTNDSCAVEVNFGSYGSGIDGDALDKVVKAIDSRKLYSTAKPIGREGERRICLPLTELKDREKTAFIDELKKIAKEGQLVSVSIR